jgi:hypothetical protein
VRCCAALIQGPRPGLAERWRTSLATAAEMIWSSCRREWRTATHAQRRLNREDKFLARRAKSFFRPNKYLTPQAPLRVQKRQHRSENVADNACQLSTFYNSGARPKVCALRPDKNGLKQVFQGLVLDAALIYGYLYHSTAFLARLQFWFGSTADQYRGDRHSAEVEKTLRGFLLWGGPRYG